METKDVKIIIRQGVGNPPTLDSGELGLDTTNQKLHVGTVKGNKEVAMKDDIPTPQTFKTLAGQSVTGSGDIKFKTINGESVVGSGDIAITASGEALSFKTINGEVITGSGNITVQSEPLPAFKTVGGQSIVGSGNIPISTVPSFKTVNGQTITGEGNIQIESEPLPSFKTVGGQSITGSGNIPIPTVPTFKTVNNQTITGSGNINIEVPTIPTFKTINGQTITGSGSIDLSDYQEKLVSGTNVKTVGGQSLLGPGNISLPAIPTFKTIDGQEITGSGDIAVSANTESTVLLNKFLYWFRDGIAEKTTPLENQIPENTVDLMLFMGQSNMAGRGVAAQSIVCQSGHGYEFRAVTDPTKLYDIVEPFGVSENNAVVNDDNMKTGSMVSAFVEAYYTYTKTPVVGVSCSKGGSSAIGWTPSQPMGQEAIARWNSAIDWLNTNGYTIRHKFVVWNQGETDGDVNTTKVNYTSQLTSIINEFCNNQGADKFLIVRIGNNSNNPEKYDTIIATQTEICLNHENAILISTKFDSMAEDGLMKDQWHYTQEGYNITGTDAGKNTAFYVNTGIEPRMNDWEHNNMYSPDGFGSDNTNTPVTPPTSYTVTYNINGHGTQPSVVTGVTALPNPLPTLTTNDYTFNGWFTNSTLTTQAVAGATITANATLYAKWIADGGGGDVGGDVVSYIYTFDNETENGTTFDTNGTVANGMFTVSDTPTTSGVKLATPVTLSPDIDWTVEYTVQEANRGGIALWDSSKPGKGFFSYNGGGMPGFQFRDGARSLTIKANNTSGIWRPGKVNTYAVTYEASTETFKMYQNGTLLTYIYDEGSAATNWIPVNIDTFAGYNDPVNIGANAKIYYVAIHMNKVLTLEELHQE